MRSRSTPYLAFPLYKCAAFMEALFGAFATEKYIGTFREEKGISSRLRLTTVNHLNMA